MAFAAIVLTGCTSAGEGGGFGPGGSGRLKLQSLDIADAKYLSLVGGSDASRAAGESPALFKMDADGNMSAVVLTCTEEEDGTVKRQRTDIRVIPSDIIPLTEAYTYLHDCDFVDEEGQPFPMYMYASYESEGWSRFNLLVRNADGRIFYIPSAAHRYFDNLPSYQENSMSQLDGAGNLYLYCWDNSGSKMIAVTTQENGEVVVRQLNPDTLMLHNQSGEFFVLNNGTVVMLSGYDESEHLVLYPDGGFEFLSMDSDAEDPEAVATHSRLVKLGDELYSFVVSRRYEEGKPFDYRVFLQSLRVGATYGDWEYLEDVNTLLESGTDYSTDPADPAYLPWAARLSWWWNAALTEFLPLFETSQWYLFNYGFAIDKQLEQLRIWSDEERGRMILPRSDNTYAGRAWSTFDVENGIRWFDVETFESGEVRFDNPDAGAPAIWNEWRENIPGGEIVRTGIRQTDGKPVICTIRIDTGRVTVSVLEDDRPVVALVPLN